MHIILARAQAGQVQALHHLSRTPDQCLTQGDLQAYDDTADVEA